MRYDCRRQASDTGSGSTLHSSVLLRGYQSTGTFDSYLRVDAQEAVRDEAIDAVLRIRKLSFLRRIARIRAFGNSLVEHLPVLACNGLRQVLLGRRLPVRAREENQVCGG